MNEEIEIVRLSQVEMEYEMDQCPAPWLCPASCYLRCVGCQHKNNGGGGR